MEMLLYFCYYVTLFLIPIAFYSLFFKHKVDKRFHTNRDFIYLIKLYYATPAIKKYQKKCQLSLNEETKKILEYPKEVRSGIYTDNNFIYGTDQKGNSLSLRFTVRSNLISDIFLCLRLENGATYILPGDKISKAYSLSGWHWKTKQLQIEILEPFKKLRIIFNGLLANTNDSKNVEHVQFNFIWTAAGAPQFHPQDAATELLADALARQKWKDGNWLSLLGDERGYEQFGGLRGFVRGDSFNDDLFLNIPSCRTRFWTTDEKLSVKRSVHLFVAGRDGALISLWVKDLKRGCNELQHGNIIMNNGTILPITNTDLRLEFFNQACSLLTVHIYGKSKVYRTVFHINLKKSISSAELSNFSADCDQNSQQAKAIVEFWTSDKNLSRDQPPPLLLDEKHNTSSYVTTFSDRESRNVKLTGGKGCSLALMTSLSSTLFTIPDGFIVTINAFNKQLEVNFNMKKAVSLLDDICCERIKGDLQRACQGTVQVFQTEEILPEIKDTIISALKNIAKNSVINIDRYAVRSSAVGEDSEELSAAGQNETFLGCSTSDDVIKSVSQCWASLFTYQSVQYRHQHGLPIATEMAVVVQRMVPADCAGVLFTAHPSNGNPALMVITANYGLGESVVSGRSEPDTIILHRTWDNNNLSIKSKTRGLKNNRVVMVEGSGVVEEKGLEGFSVTDAQALELGQVGVLIEEKFGGARDIEWAFYKNQLFLLQSRPVTTLSKWNDWEMLHEFDMATLSEDLVYTVANTGEILPGAVSVLTLSTILKAIDNSIQKSIDNKFDIYAFKCLSTFQHHLFVDVISGIHKRVEKDVSLVSKILDLAIFGHPIIDETIHSLALTRNGVATGLDKLEDLITMIKLAWKNEEITQECKNIVGGYNLEIDNAANSVKDIYAKITKAVEKFTDVCYCHSRTTRTSVSYQVFSMTILAENCDDFTVDHYNDVALLLSSCDDVISAEIPNTLAKITKILVDSKMTDEFIKSDNGEGREWLKKNSPEAAKIFEIFLEKHGHRAMGEFDVYNPTWATNPSEVIKMIKANCKSAVPKQEKITPSIDNVVANLVSPKRSSTRKILKFLMKKSRKAVGLREQTKSETIKFVDKLRMAYNLLGHKMALAGLIPDANLIFHLSHYEVGQILDRVSNGPLLINKALKRQKFFSKWNQLKFPEISYGVPRSENRDFIPRTGLSLIRCVGTPVCTGIIQARACVITDLAEIDQLNQGDILITYCTDIAWSPYFPILGGIVTELGGLVSHGAVIAREYGLPCIVGAKGATKLFKTGDTIILSGKDGIIELVQN